MIEALVRDRWPAAVPLAEAMVAVLRDIPGPVAVELRAFYEEACWARAALAHGATDLPEEHVPVVAAFHAGPIVSGEPAAARGRRVAFDAAPVRMVYLLEVAGRLRTGDHPVPLPRTASRVARRAVGEWNLQVRWCEAMLYGLGSCTAWLEAAVTPPPWSPPAPVRA
jgi:hypothetical protein